MKRVICSALAALSLCCSAYADPIGPLPYLSVNDSPLNPICCFGFALEDFEDGLLNTPSVSAVGAQLVTPAGGVFTDSVDSDDGTIDGSGTLGRSHYTPDGVAGISYLFSPFTSGRYPTHAGVVWTDLSGTADVFFEAFDRNGASLGVINAGALNDGVSTGETAEDRFLGWEHGPGISRIHVYQSGSDMEVDHLQYGVQAPEPTTAGLALTVIAFCCIRRC